MRLRQRICAMLALAVLAASARAGTDLMTQDPVLEPPVVRLVFKARSFELWLNTLAEGDVPAQAQAAHAIALAAEAKAEVAVAGRARIRAALEKLPADAARAAARYSLVQALIYLDDRESAALLLKLNQAGDDDMIVLSDEALARWAYADAAAVWLKRLEDEKASVTVRRSAVMALGNAKHRQAAPRMAELVTQGETAMSLRLAAASTLAQLDEKTATAAAKVVLARPGTQTHAEVVAATLLRGSDEQDAVALLSRLLQSRDAAARVAAGRRLLTLAPEKVVAVAPQLAEGDGPLRLLAVEALATKGASADLALLARLLQDQLGEVRRAAKGALRAAAVDDAARAKVLRAVATLDDSSLGAAQCERLVLRAELGDVAAIALILRGFESAIPGEGTRAALALQAGYRRWPEEEQARVAKAFAEALERRGKAMEKPSKVLTPQGLDRVIEDLAALSQVAGVLRLQQASAVLEAHVKRATLDERTRSAACWALGKMHEGTGDKRVTRLLSERLLDRREAPNIEHERVRAMAGVGLSWIGGPEAEAALHRVLDSDPPLVRVVARWHRVRTSGKAEGPVVIERAAPPQFLEALD